MSHANRPLAALLIGILCLVPLLVHSCAPIPTTKPTLDAYLDVICNTHRPMRERQRIWHQMRKDYPSILPF